MTRGRQSGVARALGQGVSTLLLLSFSACGPDAPPGKNPAASPSPPKSGPSPAAPSTSPNPQLPPALREWLASPDPSFAADEERAALGRIYPQAFETALWLDGANRLTFAAQDALALFGGAAAEGLDPRDYRAGALSALAKTIETRSPTTADLAAFDGGVSLSLLRYLRHFHRGRINPRDIGFSMSLPADEHDYASIVRDAAFQSRVREAAASITPPLVQYRSLRAMLKHYRGLAGAEGTTLPPFPEAPEKPVKPGESTAGLEIVRTRLVALGDLRATTATLSDPAIYEEPLLSGVKRFQTRHGFLADGILGKTTWTALSVPLSYRARQIELAMERMRWLPHLGERAFVAVNIPMFTLWGWDAVPETGAPSFQMGVIVGKALDTRTPVFLEEMRYLIFRPFWNVPKSILQNEILPILRKDPGYLDRQEMEMVEGESDEARPVPATSENVTRLAQGKLRLRQRPGPKNALGEVKFIFPNDENVYMHSTPSRELFGRARRDFSHGCVRVQDPVALAQWALKDQPQWTRERIQAAMKGAPSLRVPLTRSIRVVMYYVTATVMPDDNSIHFAEDIYGHDPRLDQALRAHSSGR